MIADLAVLADCNISNLAAFAQELSSRSGFVDELALSQMASKSFPEAGAAEGVAKLVYSLSSFNLDYLLSVIDNWHSAREPDDQAFTDEQLERIRERLRTIVKSYPAIDRYRKAEQLSIATGRPLSGVRFICDARPLFDDPRERIEGFTLVTTMTIDYLVPAEKEESIEFILSEADLDSLAQEIAMAKQKLNALTALLATVAPHGLVDCWGKST